MVYEQQQTVGDVHVTDSAVKVQREHIQFGNNRLDPFFDALGHNMVGNAPERLQTDDIVYPLTGIRQDFGRKQPTFAKLGIQRDNLLGLVSLLKISLNGLK